MELRVERIMDETTNHLRGWKATVTIGNQTFDFYGATSDEAAGKARSAFEPDLKAFFDGNALPLDLLGDWIFQGWINALDQGDIDWARPLLNAASYYLDQGKPLPPSLAAWLSKSLTAARSGVDPARALGLKSRRGVRSVANQIAQADRDRQIAAQVRRLMRLGLCKMDTVPCFPGDSRFLHQNEARPMAGRRLTEEEAYFVVGRRFGLSDDQIRDICRTQRRKRQP